MISVGTDIVAISRIKDAIVSKKDAFLTRIYTKKEIDYCNALKNPYISFSGKYAAKEAIKKAILSKELLNRISLKDIEILNKKSGSPYVKLAVSINKHLDIDLSISHDGEYAVGFAVITIL